MMMNRRRPIALATCAIAAGILTAGCAHSPSASQPAVQARAKPLITADGLRFKDLNGNGKLDAYEDWRRPVDARVADLVAQMTLQERAGLMLIENPYVDEDKAGAIVGQPAFREAGLDVQRKSVVLLQNNNKALPVAAGARIYTMGLDTAEARKVFAQVTNGEAGADGAPLPRDAAGNVTSRPSAAGFERAIVRVEVGNAGTSAYRTKDPTTGANPAFVNPLTGKVWGATDPCITHPAANPLCVDDSNLGAPTPLGLVFGGAVPWEANNLSFTTMAASKSWRISPSLADIQAVMKEIGPDKVVLGINFRQPCVIDEASALRQAGALVAGFGVSNTALLDVLSGKARPQGKLPFSLANSLRAVIDNQPDAPGYPAKDTLYPFGFGISY